MFLSAGASYLLSSLRECRPIEVSADQLESFVFGYGQPISCGNFNFFMKLFNQACL
jgi:hypothetical protein